MKHNTPVWHRLLHALHFGSVTALVSTLVLASGFSAILLPTASQNASAAVSVFPASSFWNAQIPRYSVLHPNSSQLAADVARQASQFGAGIDTTVRAASVYQVDQTVTPVTVTVYDCGYPTAGLADAWRDVPVPFYAVPSPGLQRMTVYSPSQSTIWEFGGMRQMHGQWEACLGGKITTHSEGVFASPNGLSSSGLAVLGGQLSEQELRSGTINHTVGLRLPQTNGSVWPATQSSGSVLGSPALGMRLRINPAIDVASLGLSPAASAIARAGQTHGFVVYDVGSTVGFTAEHPVSYTYRGLANPYDSLDLNLAGFPWGSLEAMPTEYGQDAVVPAVTSFSASQSTVKADGRVTLSWRSEHVNRCAVAGVADNLPASGSIMTPILKSDSTFVIRCGGPGGTASSAVSIRVIPLTSNEPLPELPPARLIDQPYSGYANVLPELMNDQDAATVYKVVYYEDSKYIAETAKPPFALNSSRLKDGTYTIEARIYHRDGRTEQRALKIQIQNGPEILFAVTQSSPILSPPSLPKVVAVPALLLTIAAVIFGTWWGYHRAHLL